jgi:hypothetical protein
MDHPTPGKLLRLEFCPKQQDELAGIWDPSSPQAQKLTPCANLTFDRVRDPKSCHFKNKEDMSNDNEVSDNKLNQPEDIQKDEAGKDTANRAVTPNSASTPADPTPASPHTGTRFLPINAAAVAKPALASPTKDKASPTKRVRTTSEDKVVDGDKANKANNTDNNADKGNDNNDKMDIDPPSATTDTNTDTDIVTSAAQRTPSKHDTNKQTGTMAPPDPVTPSGRKRLPDNRPRTPRVLEATAAAAAAAATAEAASRVPGGQWTHEETIKLLALRAKGIEFEGMGEVRISHLLVIVFH